MNPNWIIGEVISSALGVRHRRHHHHHPFDVIAGGHPWWLNGGTLMTALGIAWGMLDTANAASSASASRPFTTSPASQASQTPSQPGDGAATAPANVAPVPAEPTVPVEVARVIRLTVSAARADGTLTDAEQDAIRTRARAVGADALVDEELKTPTPLARLVAGAPATSRNELYTLAFAIVHADGTVAGAERIYLAQLAHALGLSAEDAAALEQTASERLTAVEPRAVAAEPGATQDASMQDKPASAAQDRSEATPDVS
jgi:uncharacterized membrane protein YebE (DUF533 family)